MTVTDLADQQAFAEALASADILTNGTKVGMKPLENESLVNDISLLHPGLLHHIYTGDFGFAFWEKL